MEIKLTLNHSERILFCSSKWWGDTDMPENMEYPTIQVTDEDGETYDYPLTFVCQINCEDIASYDPDGRLPHEGMLYFFAAIDKWLGYDSPTQNDIGEWSKGHLVVKYAKTINFETFQSRILIDDEGQSLTEREMEISFESCEDDACCVKLLGVPSSETVQEKYPMMLNLLQIVGLESDAELFALIKESDLKFGNWKKTLAFVTQSVLC